MQDPSTPLAGTFAPLQLPRLAAHLVAACPRGKLVLSQGKATRFLWFEDGRILAITSSLEEEKLGSWLVERGRIDRRTVDDTLRRQTGEKRFGTILVEKSYLTADVLCQELERLSLHLAARLAFDGGTYATEADCRLPGDAIAIDYEPTAVFAAAVQHAPDTGQFERLTGGTRTWLATPHAALAELEGGATGIEKFLLGQLAQPRTLAELRAAVPQKAKEVPRALTWLAVQGLVYERSSTAAAAEPAFPPANPRLRALLAQVDPRPARKMAAGGGPAPAGPPPQPELDYEQAEEHKTKAYEVLRDSGDPRQAHKLLAKAVEVAPDATALTVLAELEMHNPLWRPRALERLRQATALAPHHTPAWLALANYWSLRLQPDKQRRCLERILSYEPLNREARQTLEMLADAATG
ncbi:MAG TPA: hypothetical protein P5234_02705 [Thermoanaerobaculaceae bacterium]|nr:hypothetical protein [Thermoanaerobaculaceae bacterium]HRS15138.1 hypothetical protein [Thermoanaerobaculaceae bacterium]